MTPITTDMKSFTYNSVSYVVVEVPKDIKGYDLISVPYDFMYGKYEILGEITRNSDGYPISNFKLPPSERVGLFNKMAEAGILLLNPMGTMPSAEHYLTERGWELDYHDWSEYELQLLGKDKKLIVLRQKK